jgi:hypothetical protein
MEEGCPRIFKMLLMIAGGRVVLDGKTYCHPERGYVDKSFSKAVRRCCRLEDGIVPVLIQTPDGKPLTHPILE